MRLDLRKALWFAVQFVPLFLLTVWLYSVAVPVYRAAVFKVANTITAGLPASSEVEVLPDGRWHAFTTTEEGQRRTIDQWHDYTTHLLFLSLALLPALILATPAPPLDRLRLLGVGLALLFVVHVACVIGLVRETMCLIEHPGRFHCLWVLRVVYASGQIFGALLWGLLTWRYWFPAREAAPPAPPAPPAGPAVAMLCLAVVAGSTGCAPGPADRPDLIVIVVDTLRADHLGAYGHPGDISPTLDRLAAESRVFDRAFSQSPWTKPSTASLFTSLYPEVHRVTDHEGQDWGKLPGVELKGEQVLAPEAVTLAEMLAENGYRTAAFVANPFLSASFGFDQGFETYDVRIDFKANRADRLATAALEWLDGLDPDEPFFLYLHVMDVHAPYAAPLEDFEALRNEIHAPDLPLRDDLRPDRMFNNIEVPADWATDAMRHSLAYWKTRYAAGVRMLDRRLAPLFDELRARGIDDSSYLVLTSDHGEELFEHGSWSHGFTLYDHQLRIPLLIRAPGGAGGGQRVADLVEAVDVMPTLLSLLGIVPPGSVQGRDLAALWSGGRVGPLEHSFAGASLAGPRLHSVRTPDHKLIVDPDRGTTRLYDLKTDPGEQRDIAKSEPRLAATLAAGIRTHLVAVVADGVLEPGAAEIPPEVLESIEALGYVGRGAN